MAKKKLKINGVLRLYIIWPLLLIPVAAFITVLHFSIDLRSGFVALAFTLLYTAFAIIFFVLWRPKFLSGMVHFAASYNKLQRRLSKELLVPYAVLDVEGRIVWSNDAFAEIVGVDKVRSHHVFQLFDGIDAG